APRRDPAPGAEARVGLAVGELELEERKREPLEAALVEAPGLLAHPGEQLGVEGGAGGIGAHGTPCASRSSAPARTSRSMPSGGVIEITLPSSPDASAITPRRSADAQAAAARSPPSHSTPSSSPRPRTSRTPGCAARRARRSSRAKAPSPAARSTSFSSSSTASEASAAAQPGGGPRKAVRRVASPPGQG